MVHLWLVLLVVLLLVVFFMVLLFVLCYRRISRDRANLRISRDRANLDLQILSHQVQVRVRVQADDSASLPDSLPAKRCTSLIFASTASFPPGPPSSSTGRSVGPAGGGDADGADLVQNIKTCSSLPSPGAPSGTAGEPSTAPPLAWAEADTQFLVAQGATNVEGLVMVGSSQSSTGFEGVYESGGGFGAELVQKGAKRLRQDGFRSPVEAALARARWTKGLKGLEGKEHAPSATARASSAEQELLVAEALADLAMAEGATVAQPFVSAKEAAHTKYKEGRWLPRLLRNLRPSPLLAVAQHRAPLPAQTHSGVVAASVAVVHHPAVASVPLPCIPGMYPWHVSPAVAAEAAEVARRNQVLVPDDGSSFFSASVSRAPAAAAAVAAAAAAAGARDGARDAARDFAAATAAAAAAAAAVAANTCAGTSGSSVVASPYSRRAHAPPPPPPPHQTMPVAPLRRHAAQLLALAALPPAVPPAAAVQAALLV